MTVYVGAIAGAGVLVRWPICFTGPEAAAARALIALVEVLAGAVVGTGIGALVSVIFGPEAIPAGALLGFFAGAVAGGIITVFISVKGMCTCPPGSDGFCIALVFFRVPGTTQLIPLWPFAIPDPGSCPTLVPPGCP